MLTTPYWWEHAPPADTSADTPLPARTDVAIIGGGYTGVSAARTLARHGVDVTVLEREVPGWGASTRNGGMVLPGFKREAGPLLAKYGRERARALFAESVESVDFLERVVAEERIDCGWARTGYVTLAWKRAHLAGLARDGELLEREFGYRTVLVPAERVGEEIGSTSYHGGLLDGRAGGVQPAQLFRGLERAARRAGARLVAGVEARTVRREPGGYAIDTSRGPLRCRELIVATNGYSGPVHAGLRRRVVPLGSHMIATAPLEPALARSLIPRGRMLSDSKNLLFYFRLSADHRLLFGGRASFRPNNEAGSARSLAASMRAIYPQLANTPIEYSWWGNVALTVDQMPHAGRMDGVWYALGYCGHGVAMSGYLGARLGDAVAGLGDLRPFDGLPFRAFPLYRGRPWFLPAVGAWFRLVDILR